MTCQYRTTNAGSNAELELTFIPMLGIFCVVSQDAQEQQPCASSANGPASIVGDDDWDVSSQTDDDDIEDATVAGDEWKQSEVLLNEMNTTRRMLETNGNESESLEKREMSSAALNATIAADKAEDVVRQMAEATSWMNEPTLFQEYEEDEEDNDYSLEEYEVNSAALNATIAADKAEDVVRRMAEATAWIEEDGANDEEEEPQLEWDSYWSEAHNKEYYQNRDTNQSCWSKPHRIEIDFTGLKEMKTSVDVWGKPSKSIATESTASSVTTCIHLESEWKSIETK